MSESQTQPRRKVVEFTAAPLRALSLISLLLVVTTWLPQGAQARNSQILNQDQANLQKLRKQYEADFLAQQLESEAKPHLGQSTDGYEEFEVDKPPFSETDDYIKFNSFVLGLKLDESYNFVDECLNSVIDGMDQRAFYENFMRDHLRMVENGTRSGFFQPFLNVSGIFFGPVSSSLPNCYEFIYDFYLVESTRFTTFGSNWGNFFLAFLFNQMGNALVFQSKFERIEEARERQDYPGMWQEYGDTIYLIWDFPPLEEGALETMESYAERWLEEHEWLADDTPPVKRQVLKSGLSTLARYTHSAGNEFGKQLGSSSDLLLAKLQSSGERKQALATILASVIHQVYTAAPPQIRQSVPGVPSAEDAGLFANGFFVGVTDVFPYESNVTRCSNNVTQGSSAFDRLFLQQKSLDWSDTEFQRNLVTDLSYLLQIPYGVSYSCYYGYSTILVNEDPMADGVMTEDEELEQRIMVNNQIITNVIFNAGYMYADVLTIYGLESTDADYWNKFGIYLGDLFIRFFWRRRFTRTFDYN